MLHNKLLRLHGGYTEHASSGFVINLIATDVQRFDLASTALHFGWMAVVDLIVIGIIVCYQVRLILFLLCGLVYLFFICLFLPLIHRVLPSALQLDEASFCLLFETLGEHTLSKGRNTSVHHH
jgi:ABC-type bacteriocin/lantibiotic exporter with double-glycine peptidase domain